MLAHFFSKDPHSHSRRKEYDFSLSSSPVGVGGYSEVKLARWHPKVFPPVVQQWLAQQEEYVRSHPGSAPGHRIVDTGIKEKPGLVVAVKVVKKEAVRNNPEYFKILQKWVWIGPRSARVPDG
jgi:hypothetical protein